VFRGEDLTSNGQKNIFRKILGHLQSDRTNSFQMCTLDSHKRLKRVDSESGRPQHPAGQKF
jgi:hypothetical protein